MRARASHSERSLVGHLNDLFHAEDLILAEQVELERLLLVLGDELAQLVRRGRVQAAQLDNASASRPDQVLDFLVLNRLLPDFLL